MQGSNIWKITPVIFLKKKARVLTPNLRCCLEGTRSTIQTNGSCDPLQNSTHVHRCVHRGLKTLQLPFKDPKPNVLHVLQKYRVGKVASNIAEMCHCVGGVMYLVVLTNG